MCLSILAVLSVLWVSLFGSVPTVDDLAPLVRCHAPGIWSVFPQATADIAVSAPFALVCSKAGDFSLTIDHWRNETCKYHSWCADWRGYRRLEFDPILIDGCRGDKQIGPTIICRRPGLWALAQGGGVNVSLTHPTTIACAHVSNSTLLVDLPFIPFERDIPNLDDRPTVRHLSRLIGGYNNDIDYALSCNSKRIDEIMNTSNSANKLQSFANSLFTPVAFSAIAVDLSKMLIDMHVRSFGESIAGPLHQLLFVDQLSSIDIPQTTIHTPIHSSDDHGSTETTVD